jgi:rhamnose transport system substrate-binding protein
MASSPLLSTKQPWLERYFPNQEWVLACVILSEIALFGATAHNFLTGANAGEIVRLAVELGLLALSLTCVIITGGIDLSVGSLMGLCAVVFGMLFKESGLPLAVAALLTLLVGLAAGALNAWVITRWRSLPLIVTLATFSLFRGIAEALTQAVKSYSDFPASFLRLGQGYVFGVIPLQTFVLLVPVIGYWLLLHRTVIGRAWYAIGFSPEGARYAAIPVARRVALAYILSGLSAAIAALVYVAHTGQAKSDAGTGYELMAITAVVLGGTSIFGGRGTIGGTLLGLFALAILRNGLRLADLPAELSGVLTGVLLVATIGLDRIEGRAKPIARLVMVGALAAVSLAGWWMIPHPASPLRGHKLTVAMMPKAKGDPYFISCRQGADEAARELGVDLIWDGPTDLDPAKQNEVIDGWITRGVNVIAVSVENEAAISTVLRKARQRGIRVLTWDADSQPDARDFFINQATPEGIGNALADEAARLLNNQGEFAIVTASLSAANQNTWIKFIRARLESQHPGLKLVAIRPSDGDRDRAFAETQTVLKVYPNVKVIMGIAAPAVPGIAEAVKQSGRTDVKVTGLSLPNLCKPYVHAGVIQSVVLWNTRDLGYLTVLSAHALALGKLRPGQTSLDAGRLGKIEVRKDQVILGAPFFFQKDNIDRLDF